jgi:hypothetical protein
MGAEATGRRGAHGTERRLSALDLREIDAAAEGFERADPLEDGTGVGRRSGSEEVGDH